MRALLFYVRLWQEMQSDGPTIQQYVQASTEGSAVVLVMKQHHLAAAARASVSPTAETPPTVQLVNVYVRGGKRRWKQVLEG